MIDNNDFDRETYKNEAENIKLSKNQKEILIEKMREADRKPEKEENKPKKNKIFNTTWTRAVAASLAVALIGTACYMGVSNFNKASEKNGTTTSDDSKKSNGNLFSITANAAEIENKSVIGMFSGMNGGQFLLKDFENKDTVYRNKQGKVDYFNDYELTELNIKGSNIESIVFRSNRKGVYFVISSEIFVSSEDEIIDNENNKIIDNRYFGQKKIAESGIFSDYNSLENSQYTKAEFEEHSDGLYGEFCDGFTYTLKNPSDKEQIIEIGQAISLVVETDRTDSEIDKLMNEYCDLNDELLALRAENRSADGEFGTVSDEENEIELKMGKLNNQMVKKAVDGAVINVTVKFTDGSTQTRKINVGYYENDEDGVYFSPNITFSPA
ncbi:MAG: hypothetical protein Q4P84_04500 [Elusimicrobiales bacterium]|jgi:hypothetical protein|nr:hypothetical protein [Elusimicrobiales bacterium]